MNPDQNPNPVPQEPTPTPSPTPFGAPEASPSPVQTPPAPETTPYQAPTPEQPAQPVAPVDQPQPQNFFATQPQQSPEAPANPVQPGAPIAPVSPVGASAPVSPTPGGGKDKKKLIILISAIGGGIVLLGLVLLAVWLAFFNVTAADYEEARGQLAVLQSDMSGISASSIGSGATEPEEVTAAFAAFKEKHEALASLKAFRGDSELRELYSAYDAKGDAYVKFMDAKLPSVIRFIEVSDEISSIGSADADAFRDIAASFKSAASEISDADIKKLAEDMGTTFESLAGHYDTMYDSTATTSERLAASSAAREELTNFRDRLNEFSDTFETQYDEVDPKETFDALSEATTAKARG